MTATEAEIGSFNDVGWVGRCNAEGMQEGSSQGQMAQSSQAHQAGPILPYNVDSAYEVASEASEDDKVQVQPLSPKRVKKYIGEPIGLLE